jgi:hypothetical protein
LLEEISPVHGPLPPGGSISAIVGPGIEGICRVWDRPSNSIDDNLE